MRIDVFCVKPLRSFRALKALTNEIDPMPSEVLSEFNLVNLLDVSFLNGLYQNLYCYIQKEKKRMKI
jgi:hypothetical protein